jgi:hypothetical protein
MAQKPIKTTQIKSLKQTNPFNLQGVKKYVFNQTGNIMMSTTDTTTSEISQSVVNVFEEVSVFFAALTKALSDQGFSLYDHEALERIIDGSGLFVQVTQEDVEYKQQSASIDFSKDLLEALLGLASGTGEMAFASAMISSIGQQGLKISEGTSHSSSKVGNIVFVCEYLLGMPIVSAIVVYADFNENKQWFKLGPCISEQSMNKSLKMNKTTYMFVVPSIIKEFSPALAGVEHDASYNELIGYLESLVKGTTPRLGTLTLAGNVAADNKVVSVIETGKKYVLSGMNFGTAGTTNNKIKLVAKSTAITAVELTDIVWTQTAIMFTAGAIATGDVHKEVYITVSTDVPKLTTPVTYQSVEGQSTGAYYLSSEPHPDSDDDQ